ncbi:MAG: hypothetical protein CXR30_08375 [Geobacter sp.]|nr:MAG: hypothetical protein CXR30_08375 [Geobacter sp.]
MGYPADGFQANFVSLYFNLANVNLIASETQVILRVSADAFLLWQLFYFLAGGVRGNTLTEFYTGRIG